VPETRESRTRLVLVGVGILAFAGMLAVEVLTDDEPVRALDLLGDALQMALLVVASVATALLAVRMQWQHEEKLSLIRDLETARAESEVWRREAHTHVAGLGMAIERQFEEWGLTSAEREIGLLMLKGLGGPGSGGRAFAAEGVGVTSCHRIATIDRQPGRRRPASARLARKPHGSRPGSAMRECPSRIGDEDGSRGSDDPSAVRCPTGEGGPRCRGRSDRTLK
jgi:hypothetical protein